MPLVITRMCWLQGNKQLSRAPSLCPTCPAVSNVASTSFTVKYAKTAGNVNETARGSLLYSVT